MSNNTMSYKYIKNNIPFFPFVYVTNYVCVFVFFMCRLRHCSRFHLIPMFCECVWVCLCNCETFTVSICLCECVCLNWNIPSFFFGNLVIRSRFSFRMCRFAIIFYVFSIFFFIKKGVSYKMNFTNKTVSSRLSCIFVAWFNFLLIAVNNYVTVTDFLFPSCILENLN